MKFVLELPYLRDECCDFCKDCIAICPESCITPGLHYPVISRPGECIQCGACAYCCHADAIVMDEIN